MVKRNIIHLNEEELNYIIKNAIINVLTETVAYHFSNADFDNFDLGYVNSGNQNQAYGYGIYVSLTEKGAKNYGSKRYIVEIPSDNRLYLNDFKNLSMAYINKVKNILYQYLIDNDDEEMYVGIENELMEELNTAFQSMNGLTLYGTISSYLGSDKSASEFCYNYLHKIGLKHHSSEITNVVMFNANDIKIISKG